MQNKRLLWMDISNITASICVILLHCNHHVKYLYEGKIDFTYLWGMIVYHFAYWPVPIFMMLSGCNLLNSKDDKRTFYRKRFPVQ